MTKATGHITMSRRVYNRERREAARESGELRAKLHDLEAECARLRSQAVVSEKKAELAAVADGRAHNALLEAVAGRDLEVASLLDLMRSQAARLAYLLRAERERSTGLDRELGRTIRAQSAASTPSGSIRGHRADRLIIDDPHRAAETPVHRDEFWVKGVG